MPKDTRLQSHKADMARYCAYQERSILEVKNKLQQHELNAEEENEIINFLLEEKFVDESRLASAYTRGKFYSNKWGRVKIRLGLREKGLDNDTIAEGLKEIDNEEYRQMLVKLIDKKIVSLKSTELLPLKQKLAQYAIGKGYEYDLIKLLIDRRLEG